MGAETVPYRQAHGETEQVLSDLSGLAHALYEIASEYPAINNSDPIPSAIIALVRTIEEKAECAAELHAAEWPFVVKPEADRVQAREVRE